MCVSSSALCSASLLRSPSFLCPLILLLSLTSIFLLLFLLWVGVVELVRDCHELHASRDLGINTLLVLVMAEAAHRVEALDGVEPLDLGIPLVDDGLDLVDTPGVLIVLGAVVRGVAYTLATQGSCFHFVSGVAYPLATQGSLPR